MNRASLALTLIVPVAIAACGQRQAPPPPAPVLSLAEQACVAAAAQRAGVDTAEITITPTSSTKIGDTIYTVVAGGVAYTCVASPDGTISTFQ